jgi:hypothetical protein
MEPIDQLGYFRQAIEALGGASEVARRLDISHRNVMRFMAGTIQPNSGILADLCKELTESAQLMRDLERRLNPLFEENRVAGQRDPDGRTLRHKEGDHGDD